MEGEGGEYQNLKSFVFQSSSITCIFAQGKIAISLSAFIPLGGLQLGIYFLQFYQITLKAGMHIDHVLEPYFFVVSANIRKCTLNYLVGGNSVALPAPREQHFHGKHQAAPHLWQVLRYLPGETGGVRAAVHQRVSRPSLMALVEYLIKNLTWALDLTLPFIFVIATVITVSRYHIQFIQKS